jgi:hypothetical protein
MISQHFSGFKNLSFIAVINGRAMKKSRAIADPAFKKK